MNATDLFPALAAHVTRVHATSGSLHGLHCLSGLQLCVVWIVWLCRFECLRKNSILAGSMCLGLKGECSGAPSLLKEVAWQDCTDGLGEAISWDFPVVAFQIREALLSAIAYKKPPGADARGLSVFVCVISVCVFCVCSYAGCQIQFCSNEKTCLLVGDQQTKLEPCQIANCAFFLHNPIQSHFQFLPLVFDCHLAPQKRVTRGIVWNLSLWNGRDLKNPHMSSVVGEGVYVNKRDWTFPT